MATADTCPQCPAPTVDVAREELRRAGAAGDAAHRDRYLRDAAEKLWLAVCQETDRFIMVNWPSEAGTYVPGEAEAHRSRRDILYRHNRQDLEQGLESVSAGIHGDIFYGGAMLHGQRMTRDDILLRFHSAHRFLLKLGGELNDPSFDIPELYGQDATRLG